MTKRTTIKVDEENNAETWWDAARAATTRVFLADDVDANDLADLIDGDTNTIMLSAEDAAAFRAWAETLPGWSDGPAHAPHPFVFNEE